MRILQLSTALPADKYSTEELIGTFPCKMPEDVKQNVLNLGVSTRHLITHPNQSGKPETVMSETGIVDLCSKACHAALDEAELSAEDVDYLVVAYDVNPILSPGLSQLIVPHLDLDRYIKHVNAQGTASTAFMKALELAENHLARNSEDHVLVCVSGASSYWFHNQVQGLADVTEIGEIGAIADDARRKIELRKWVATMEFFLFGDGAAAAVLANKGKGLKMKGNAEVTNVGKKDYLAGYARLSALNEPFRFGFHSHLDKDIPKLGVKYTDLALRRLLGEKAESLMKAVKKWAVHTGSQKILAALAEHHGIEHGKIAESHEILRACGNLAGASLPFILEKIVSGRELTAGDLVLMVGYGWGFSASACLLEYRE